jgi:hypothetical protein
MWEVCHKIKHIGFYFFFVLFYFFCVVTCYKDILYGWCSG